MSNSRQPYATNWTFFAIAAAGVILSLAGMIGLAGWQLGEPILFQVHPQFAPLHFNGAIGLLIWGAGLIGLLRASSRFTFSAGIALISLGLVAATELIGATRLHLDRWLFSVDPLLQSIPPGGLSMPLAAGFVVAGMSLVIATRSQAATYDSLLLLLAGTFLSLGAITRLIGQLLEANNSTALGPPLLAAFPTILGGGALIALSASRGWPCLRKRSALPVLVGLGGVAITLVLWQALDGQQSARIHRMVQFESAHVARTLQERLQSVTGRLPELAETAPRNGQQDATWQQDVENYLARSVGCLAVGETADRQAVVWLTGRYSAVMSTSPDRLGIETTHLNDAKPGQVLLQRPPRSKWNGARVLVLYAPCRHRAGGLVAIFGMQELLDSMLNVNVAAGYALSVADGSEIVYERLTADTAYRDSFQYKLTVPVQRSRWNVHVWPTSDVMARESLSVPKLSLVVGFLTTTLLALAVHLAQTARSKARALEKEVQERLQAKGELKQSETRYRSLVENLEQGIFLKDRAGNYVAANRNYCAGLGCQEDAIIGKTDAELLEPELARTLEAESQRVLSEGRKLEFEEKIGVGEQRRVVRRILTPVRDPGGQTVAVLGICWDVTEQRRFEERLRQAGKMDAIGQLAGGIAHDFNNLLTAILGNVDLILGRPTLDERSREFALAAQSAATRAASLTQQLLGFSRQHNFDWEPTDVSAVGDEVARLLGRTIDPRIKIDVVRSSQSCFVQSAPGQLTQVLMNLCLNARDAIAGPGHIAVEVAPVTIDSVMAITHPSAQPGEFVRLSVRDTGSGMTPEVRARIFEPFFTTKEIGKGTGLGLAMVFAIVQGHHGWIDCESEPGRGTRFDIFLPRTESRPMAETPSEASGTSNRGRETILVVDDEPSIRKLAAFTLQQNGYTVLEAEDGQEALDVYARESRRIDLILLDLTMPNLSGQDAFRKLHAINPEVRVLFASGYAAESISELEKRHILGFVKKPYRPNELLACIRDALKASHARGSGSLVAIDKR